MRLNVKEAGVDAFFLNSWKCSFDTPASVSHEIFQVVAWGGGSQGKAT